MVYVILLFLTGNEWNYYGQCDVPLVNTKFTYTCKKLHCSAERCGLDVSCTKTCLETAETFLVYPAPLDRSTRPFYFLHIFLASVSFLRTTALASVTYW